MPFPWLPLANIGSSILSNIGAKKRQQQADQQNIKFWQMQNAYNTPAQQMARLKKAGLNPALIYGSGSTNTGIAGSVAPSKPAPYNIKNPVPDMLQTMLINEQYKGLQLDNEGKQIDNDYRRQGNIQDLNIKTEKALQQAVKTKEISAQQMAQTKSLQAKARLDITNANYQEGYNTFRLGLIDKNIDPNSPIGTTLLRWFTTSADDKIKELKQPEENQKNLYYPWRKDYQGNPNTPWSEGKPKKRKVYK